MISSPGIGSNLDVNSIVSQLMAIESLPLSVLAQQEGTYQAKLSSLGQIKSALSGFQTAAEGLTNVSDEDAYIATSGDNSILTASASSAATVGSYSVSVSQLASGQRLVASGQADPSATIGNGNPASVTISFGTISGGTFDPNTGRYTDANFTVDPSKTPLALTIDSSNNTLEGIRDAINALDANVTAEIINDGGTDPYRLVISNSETGVSNSLKVDVSGNNTIRSLLRYDAGRNNRQELTQLEAAADATLKLNGLDINRPTNEVSDVISGVTLNLEGVGDTTVTVSRDLGGMQSALEAMVSSYNDLNGNIKETTGFEAILQGERAAVYTQNRLRSALGESLAGVGQFSTLSELGVNFQRDGSLKFDSSKFQTALETSVPDVRTLIAAFGESLTVLSDQLTSDNGPLNSRTEGINRSIDDINDRRDVLNRRLESTEARRRAQFTALDSLVSGLLATSNFLQQQLPNLPTFTNQNRN